MKKLLSFFILLLFIVSCSESNEDILNRVSINLIELKTIKYESIIEVLDDGQIVHKNTDTLFFDFTNENQDKLKYHFSSKNGELIYNGTKTYQSINQEKIIITNENNNPESINNPLLLTINPLKHILPKLIENENVQTFRKNDTIINYNQYYVFSFLLEKRYIDWIALEFKEGIDYDSEYFLMIDKANYLPYKIISPNGKNGSMSRTIQNIELDLQFSDEFWSGENLPKDYTVITENKYFSNRKNNMLTNLGKELTDWELPELNTDALVNSSKLRGNVILLEFWFKNCGGCVMAISSLNKIKNTFNNDNFKMYGIEYTENHPKDNLEKYLIEQNILYPSLYKGKEIASNYGIRSAPTFMIIDKSGTIIHITSGFSKESMDEIINIIETNL
jgi:thiol-disulfide isomerase/thioredoxin